LAQFNPVLLLWKWYDYLFFYLLIPAILTAFYVLPDDLKDYLVLWPSNPTFVSLLFSSYVHVDFNHFISNLSTYLFITFFLFNFETNRRLFYQASFMLLLLLPIISSLLIICFLPALKTPGIYVLGFSLITSGFAGYSIYAIFNYLKNVLKIPFKLILHSTNILTKQHDNPSQSKDIFNGAIHNVIRIHITIVYIHLFHLC